MICKNCGAELDIGAKFCMECGTPVPQVKGCVQCGMELPLKAKFCFGCGAPQDVVRSSAGVNMGDKNVIAGDVIGQKIAGDNVQSKIMGNAFFSTVQDDTKRVNSCHVCGKHLTNDNGHTCPGCGNVVCEEHFDAKANLCLRCAATEKEKNIAKYKDALQEVLADGVIDFNERASLKRLQVQLGISDQNADSCERVAKMSRMHLAESLTTIESINLKKTKELFYEDGEIEKAYQLVEPIYNAHPFEEKILNLYLPILVQYDINKAKQTVQSIKVDCLALCIAEIEIALQEDRLDIVEKKVRLGKTLWPDNGILKYFAALLYIRLAFVSSEDSYFDEAKNVVDSFVETDDKIERTLQAKMRKVLSVLYGLPYSEIESQTLYKALYLRNVGINEISVGAQKRIKLIQQAINLVDVGGTVSVDAGVYKEQLVFPKSFKLVGARCSLLNKSSNSLPIIVLDSDKTCKLSKAVEIEGVVFTHNADLSFDNLNEYARTKKQFDANNLKDYGEDGWNSLLLVECDSVLSNVGILDSENYGITFSKGNAKVINSIVSRCEGCVYCVEYSNAMISESMISHSAFSAGAVVVNKSKPTIVDCEIFGHLFGIFEMGSACGTYLDCDIYGNIACGVGFVDSASGSFRNSHIHDNKEDGFSIGGKSTPKIKCCKIHDNKTEGENKPGITVWHESKPVITDCEIFGHLGDGISESDNACGTYSDCDIYGNSGSGVEVKDSASGAFKNCHVHDNKIHGFFICGESTPKIENCKIHDNKTEKNCYPGIVVKNNSKPTITDCEIFGHLSCGIWEKDNACGTYVNCNIHDNAGTDISREH